MSYRHSSYRKLKKVMRAVREMSPDLDPEDYPRSAGNRVSHWLNARPMDKPSGWGEPARSKADWWTQVDPAASARTLTSRAA